MPLVSQMAYLRSTSILCEAPTGTDGLCLPQGPGPQGQGTLQILAELANERGREGE